MEHIEFTVSEDRISLPVLQHLHTVLQQLDAGYPSEQQHYRRFQQQLQAALPEALNAAAFISALETRLSAELTYVSWLGFALNANCFHDPACKSVLELDYEELHQETLFRQFPQVEQASLTIEAFLKALPENCLEAAEGITDFFSYLETVGFKLAHYWGFQFANRFLPGVIPGYAPDPFFTAKYRRMLEQDLAFGIA